MPNIEHISDSSIPSILDNNIKIPSTFYSNVDYEKYFTFKNRKYSIEAEYIENVRTRTHKSYPTLDLVPRSPRDDLCVGVLTFSIYSASMLYFLFLNVKYFS